MGLERFGRGEGGDVEVLALLEETFIDVLVAWLSRTSGFRYSLAYVRADEEGAHLWLINCRFIAKHV